MEQTHSSKGDDRSGSQGAARAGDGAPQPGTGAGATSDPARVADPQHVPPRTDLVDKSVADTFPASDPYSVTRREGRPRHGPDAEPYPRPEDVEGVDPREGGGSGGANADDDAPGRDAEGGDARQGTPPT